MILLGDSMKKLIVTSIIAIAFVLSGIDARPQKIDESAWMTVTSEKGEFSLRMPKSSLVHVDDAGDYPQTTLFGFDRGVTLRFACTKTSKAREFFRAEIFPERENASFAEQRIDGVDLRTVVSHDGIYRISISAAGDRRHYYLSITGKDRDDPAIFYVVNSIRIKNKPIVQTAGGTTDDPEQPVDISTLENSPEVADALKFKRPKWKGKVTYAPLASFKKSEPDDNVREPFLLGVFKPVYYFPPWPKNGVIRLKVVLKADGTVGDISIFSDVDRSTLAPFGDRARRLRFLPAIGVDGKPVDFTRDYLFTFFTRDLN